MKRALEKTSSMHAELDLSHVAKFVGDLSLTVNADSKGCSISMPYWWYVRWHVDGKKHPDEKGNLLRFTV
jgi:hypothetical protein